MAQGPIPPICDLDCQKQKKISALQTSLTEATKGHGALSSQKDSQARDEAETVIRNYTQQYESLKTPVKNTKDVTELKKEIKKEKSQTDILNRLSQFANVPSTFDWLGLILDGVIAMFGIILVYLVFSRFLFSASEVVVESSDVTI